MHACSARQRKKSEHISATFSLTSTLSPFAPLVCFGDTIFRDGFGYPYGAPKPGLRSK